LLRNRVYLGELRSGADVNVAAHEPLVSLGAWEAAQTGVRRGRLPSKEPALLAGVVRCGSCGRVMSRGAAPRTRGGFVYVCHSAADCPDHPTVVAAALDEHVERIALEELGRVRWAPSGEDVAAADAAERVRVAEGELSAYVSAVSAADVGVEVFAVGARRRREAVEVARRDLALLERPEAVPVNARVLWPDLSVTERNMLLRSLLEAVVVWPAGGAGRRVPVGDRCQVLLRGAGVVPVHDGPPEVRRVPVPIGRVNDAHAFLARPGEHDLG
jgi:hypothetical protein